MLFLITTVMVLMLIFRLVHVLRNRCTMVSSDGKCGNVKTAIVIGSGGHTSEMLRIVRNMNPKWYSPRIYILAEGDTTSKSKILAMECKFLTCGSYELQRIPRSREVGQSYFTSVFTTMFSVLYCIPLMIKLRPNLILCNGPGTCIPICFIAFLMKIVCISRITIVFIESVCRVKTLSLSGKILLCFADAVCVQWPQLQMIYKQTKYLGRLV